MTDNKNVTIEQLVDDLQLPPLTKWEQIKQQWIADRDTFADIVRFVEGINTPDCNEQGNA